jgi:hypothetical protein
MRKNIALIDITETRGRIAIIEGVDQKEDDTFDINSSKDE